MQESEPVATGTVATTARMETVLPSIFALLVGVAGWYYMFYSSAAANLSGVERPDVNRVRVLLRRFGGLMMICLAVAFYVGAMAVHQQRAAVALTCLVIVVVLLCVVVALGLIDLWMTRRLRSRSDHQE